MSCSRDGNKFDQGHCSTFILIQIYRSFLSHKENTKNVFSQKNANIYMRMFICGPNICIVSCNTKTVVSNGMPNIYI
jgi:hypothetical protein